MSGVFCFGIGIIMFCPPQGQTAVTVSDSYCAAYQRIIRSEHEGAALAAAPLAVRQRIAANDTLYRCQCEGWQNPICANAAAAEAARQ